MSFPEIWLPLGTLQSRMAKRLEPHVSGVPLGFSRGVPSHRVRHTHPETMVFCAPGTQDAGILAQTAPRSLLASAHPLSWGLSSQGTCSLDLGSGQGTTV